MSDLEAVPADDVRDGDMLDLEGDEYATMPNPDFAADESYMRDHDTTVSTFSLEYADVEDIVRESPDCIVIHTTLTSFACPPGHLLKRVKT